MLKLGIVVAIARVVGLIGIFVVAAFVVVAVFFNVAGLVGIFAVAALTRIRPKGLYGNGNGAGFVTGTNTGKNVFSTEIER